MKRPQAMWRNALPEGITFQVWIFSGRHTAAPRPWATRAKRSTLDVPSRESYVVISLCPALSSGAHTSPIDDRPGSLDASTSVLALLTLGGCSTTTLGLLSSTTCGGCVGSSRADDSGSAFWVNCSDEVTSSTALRGFFIWPLWAVFFFPFAFLPIS